MKKVLILSTILILSHGLSFSQDNRYLFFLHNKFLEEYGLEDVHPEHDRAEYHVLTIYEKSDDYGVSAIRRKETSRLPIPHFKEIELNTNLGHGFLYKPDEGVDGANY